MQNIAGRACLNKGWPAGPSRKKDWPKWDEHDRLRPISTSANSISAIFWMLNFWTTKGGPQRVEPRKVGGQNFELFSLSRHRFALFVSISPTAQKLAKVGLAKVGHDWPIFLISTLANFDFGQFDFSLRQDPTQLEQRRCKCLGGTA